MGHRLSKIVTRTGDAGTTGLGDGSRVAKDSPRIDAIGAVDELNSTIGVVLAETLPPPIRALLIDVQHDLFDLGGELSIPGYSAVTAAQSTVSASPCGSSMRTETITSSASSGSSFQTPRTVPGGMRTT